MGRRHRIQAMRTVPVQPEALFEFLSDLENHWRIADRFVEVVALEGPPGRRHGGVVNLRGPLGIRRTARTQVLAASEPRGLVGRAELGEATSATVRWTLWPTGAGTRVELTAVVEAAGRLDRLLLTLGGRAWLGHRFAGTLERLAAARAAGAGPAEPDERRTPCLVSSRC